MWAIYLLSLKLSLPICRLGLLGIPGGVEWEQVDQGFSPSHYWLSGLDLSLWWWWGAVVDSLAASLTLTHNTVPALDPAVVTSKNVSGHCQIGPGDKVTHSHEALTQVEYLALHFAESTLNS